jgi:hypothetical protein
VNNQYQEADAAFAGDDVADGELSLAERVELLELVQAGQMPELSHPAPPELPEQPLLSLPSLLLGVAVGAWVALKMFKGVAA